MSVNSVRFNDNASLVPPRDNSPDRVLAALLAANFLMPSSDNEKDNNSPSLSESWTIRPLDPEREKYYLSKKEKWVIRPYQEK